MKLVNWFIKRDRDGLDVLQLLITLLIAVGGFWLNAQQKDLSLRMQREGITFAFTDQVFKYLDDLGLKKEEKKDIIIGLLEIITEANISEGEFQDNKRRMLLPLRVALITESSDMLAHLGADRSKRAWVELAERSGNVKVRATAIKALGQLGKYGVTETENNLLFCLEKIMSVSENLKNEQTRIAAIEAVNGLIDVIETDLTIFANEDTTRDHATQYADILRASLQNVYENLLQIRANLSARIDRTNRQSVSNSKFQQHKRKADSLLVRLKGIPGVVKAVEADITATETSTENREISMLINNLTSNNSEVRRSARVNLATWGNTAVVPLCEALIKKQTDHSIQLGVAYTFYLMEQPVIIEKQEYIKSFVDLIGAKDSIIRKYASEFLMKLTDPSTIKLVYNELDNIITKKANGNGVYNAVVVLGTWLRTTANKKLKSMNIDVKLRLGHLKDELELETKGWPKTIELIDEML
jgi:HEAT repeat protein